VTIWSFTFLIRSPSFTLVTASVHSSPARSRSDMLMKLSGMSSEGGGPIAPRSVGAYFTSYLCLATERMAPGSSSLRVWAVIRTPFTLMPLRLPKSLTNQYPSSTESRQ